MNAEDNLDKVSITEFEEFNGHMTCDL